MSLLIAAPFLLHTARLVDVPLIDTLERLAFDTRLRLTLPGTVDDRIVIVDVDEKTLELEGRFPWPRDKLAHLVDQLFDRYDISLLGFDMVFAEADESRVLDQLNRIMDGKPDSSLSREIRSAFPARDASFASSISGRPVVLGYYFSHDIHDKRRSGTLPEPVLPAEIADVLEVSGPVAQGYGANLDILQQAAGRGGYFDNVLGDNDGIYRRAPTVQSYDGAIYDSLALAMAQYYLGETLVFGKNMEWIYLGDRAIPVDEDMAVLIPYRGPEGSFRYVSASDVLRGEVADPAVLKNKIVIFGASASGMFDLRNTPVQTVYPGVEIHANLLSGILDERFLSRAAYTVAAELVVLFALAVLMAYLMPMLSAIWSIVLTLSILGTLVSLNLYLWVSHDTVLPLAGSLTLVLILYLFNASLGFLGRVQ